MTSDGKIKIAVWPSDYYGCCKFRCDSGHQKIEQLYPNEFVIDYDHNPVFDNLSKFDEYDLVFFHKGLYRDMEGFRKTLKYFKEKKIVTVMDVDDLWVLHQSHPNYASNKQFGYDKMIQENLGLVDYVTTTTPIFANKIREFNPNVLVFPNAIDPEEKQFVPNPTPSERLRFGFIMGSSHEPDMESVRGMVAKLPKDVLDKIQICLCGFDLRGSMKIINKATGEVTERPIEPKETVWYKYELNVTDNYRIISQDYKNFLNMFLPDVQYPNVANEPYARYWTKDVNNYGTLYNNIDVLLVPLKETYFNSMKSQLKVIEAGFHHKAIIAQDYGAYQIDLIPMIEKGGKINPNGNALLVDPAKNHKQWAKYIEKLVKEPEMVQRLRDNLYNTVKDTYNLNKVSADRAQFYRDAISKKRNS